MTARRIPILAYDWATIGLVLLINLVGLITLYSAAPTQGVFIQQLVSTVLSILAATVLQLFSRRQIFSWAYPLYILSIVLLAVVLVIGHQVNGAKAWLGVGAVSFQPSELAKLGLVLTLARILVVRPLERPIEYLWPSLLTLPILGLIFLEPDLGGTLVLLAGFLGMLFVRGMPTRHILVGLVAAVLLVPTIVWPHLNPYQRERVTILFDLSKDPQGKGFQQIQSTIAIGSGGLLGKGYGEGTQTQLGFVPERQTDFIFSVLAEEWGLAGAVALLGLYALLLFRLGRMILECVRLEDRLVITGILSMLAFQMLVNIAVTLGLAPVTGITLPLISKGGSSLLMVYVSIGLVLLLHRDRYREV